MLRRPLILQTCLLAGGLLFTAAAVPGTSVAVTFSKAKAKAR